MTGSAANLRRRHLTLQGGTPNMFHSRIFTALVLVALAVTPSAHAGIADSPLPVLVAGETTLHLYSVPGVIDSSGLGTFFSCTSLEDTATVQVGIEIFLAIGGPPSNDAAATSLSLPPGATRIFGTGVAVGISV